MRSPTLFSYEVRDFPLGLGWPGSAPLRLPGTSHHTLRNQTIEGAFGPDRDDACDRSASVGDDNLASVAYSIEILAEVVSEFLYANFHRRSVPGSHLDRRHCSHLPSGFRNTCEKRSGSSADVAPLESDEAERGEAGADRDEQKEREDVEIRRGVLRNVLER